MRIALAGVGHWHARMHLDAIRHAGAMVSAVWDPDPRVAEMFGASEGVPIAASLEALLAARPDLVVVMGHPHAVPMTARATLAAGLPMMLEKPAAATTSLLAALAPTHDAFVAVPLANRCSPLWTELDRLRIAGRAGSVVHAQFRIINGPPDRYRTDGVSWMLDPDIAGGGALRNLGLHALDAAQMLFGDAEPVLSAAHVTARMHGEKVDDYALATLCLPGGPIITIETGYTYASRLPGGDFEWRVSAHGAYLIDRGGTCEVATLDDGAAQSIEPLAAGLRYRAFMVDTLHRLRRGARPLAGFDDYVRAMQLADRIYALAGAIQ